MEQKINRIKCVLIDPFERNKYSKGKVVEINPTLEEYYKTIKCDYIDIVQRFVGDKQYDIIVDDLGLVKGPEYVKTSCINPASYFDNTQYRDNDFLVGRVLISKYDEESGQAISLDEEDIKNIKEHIQDNVLIMYGRENEESEIIAEAKKHGLSKNHLLDFFSYKAIENDMTREFENNSNLYSIETEEDEMEAE